MDVDLVADDAGLDLLEEDWRRLDAADPTAEFYTTVGCVRAWWASFSALDTMTLRVFVVRHNGQVVGILPLAVHVRPMSGTDRRVLRFASHGDWFAPVLDPQAPRGTVLKALLDAVDADDAWDVLRLDGIRAGSPLCSYALGSDRWNPALRHRVEHPRILLAGVPDLAAFERRGLPAKTRKYRNRFQREHDPRFVVRDGDDADVLHRLGRLHVREKEHLVADGGRHERHSWYEDPRRVGHYERLFAMPDTVRTYCYESPDGELLAARSAFRHGRTLLSWTSAYDPALRDLRLGKVIQYDVLEHVLAEGGTDVFDFGSGRYPWKFEWTDDFDSSYRLEVRRDRPGREPSPRGSAAVSSAPGEATPSSTASGPGSARRPSPPPVRRRLRALAGRAARRARGLASRSAASEDGVLEVWHLGDPGDELRAHGSRVADVDPARLVVVQTRVGVGADRRALLAAELGRSWDAEALRAAMLDELVAAGRALGVDEDRVRVAADASRAAARAVVDDALAEHPRARHVVAADAGPDGWLAEYLRDAAARAGATLDVVPPEPGAGIGPRTQAVVDAYRTWDPDGGRLALGRTAATRYLLAVGVDPRDPRSRDLEDPAG